MEKIKVFTMFSGYGSQEMALKRAGIPYEVVAICEWDKYASTAHKAVHGDILNFGDITKVNPCEVPDHDLATYSFPCTDVSVAGEQKGLEVGTRSGLLWECEKIIREKLPKYLLCENVKNLVGKKHIGGFVHWCRILESLGYSNYWEIMNAKDHGVPQNRERFFMVSIRGEHKPYIFPDEEKLDIRLKHILEDEVDEKYYLSDKAIQGFLKHKARHDEKGTGFSWKPKTANDIANCIRANSALCPTDNTITVGIRQTGRNPEKPTSRESGLPTEQMIESNGQEVANCITTVQKDSMVGIIKAGNVNPSGNGMNGNVYHEDGLAPTITINKGEGPKIIQKCRGFNKGGEHEISTAITANSWQENNFVNDTIRIRKLTPKEAFRLMDVSDEDFEKIRTALIEEHYNGKDKANSQLYKMAGNSIVVNCMVKIFTNLFKEVENKVEYQMSLF